MLTRCRHLTPSQARTGSRATYGRHRIVTEIVNLIDRQPLLRTPVTLHWLSSTA